MGGERPPQQPPLLGRKGSVGLGHHHTAPEHYPYKQHKEDSKSKDQAPDHRRQSFAYGSGGTNRSPTKTLVDGPHNQTDRKEGNRGGR